MDNIIQGLSYDDILIIPRRSSIDSRLDVNLTSEILPGVKLQTPIIAAPMSTICESKMMCKMFSLGGLGILHRFMGIEDMSWEIRNAQGKTHFGLSGLDVKHTAIAIGVGRKDKKILDFLHKNIGIVCIDLNIGHHDKTIEMIKFIKTKYPTLKIIAGNVSTCQGAFDLCVAGADCIRATNGSGSACTTLSTTGVGVPTVTSLEWCVSGVKCAESRTGKKKFLIADGGIKNSGDMAKALAIGADAVMIGGLLAGSSSCPETAFFTENGVFKAKYYGMASKEAQVQRFGQLKKGTAPEGKGYTIPPKGKTSVIINELAGGLRSAFSFVNAKNIMEFKKNAEFIKK